MTTRGHCAREHVCVGVCVCVRACVCAGSYLYPNSVGIFIISTSAHMTHTHMSHLVTTWPHGGAALTPGGAAMRQVGMLLYSGSVLNQPKNSTQSMPFHA